MQMLRLYTAIVLSFISIGSCV